jgi:hypothetical protein
MGAFRLPFFRRAQVIYGGRGAVVRCPQPLSGDCRAISVDGYIWAFAGPSLFARVLSREEEVSAGGNASFAKGCGDARPMLGWIRAVSASLLPCHTDAEAGRVTIARRLTLAVRPLRAPGGR